MWFQTQSTQTYHCTSKCLVNSWLSIEVLLSYVLHLQAKNSLLSIEVLLSYVLHLQAKNSLLSIEVLLSYVLHLQAKNSLLSIEVLLSYVLHLQAKNIYDAYSDVDSDEERQTNYNLSVANLRSSTAKANAPSSNWYEEGDATLNLNSCAANDIRGWAVQPLEGDATLNLKSCTANHIPGWTVQPLTPDNKSNTVTMTDVTRRHTACCDVTRTGSLPMTASCMCCISQPQTVHRSSSFQPHSHRSSNV